MNFGKKFISCLRGGIVISLPSLLSASLSTFVFAKAPTVETLLWEISGKGMKQPSYLFGTVHSGCAARLQLSKEQEKALGRTQQVYIEVEPSELRSITSSSGKLAGNKTLRDIMTFSQYREVEDYYGKQVMEKNSWDKIRPAVLAFEIDSETYGRYRSRVCKSVTSKENVITDLALKRGVSILGLETAADRSNVINKAYLSLKEEVRELLEAIAFANQAVRDPSIVEETRLDETNVSVNIGGNDSDSNKITLLVARNQLWIPRMRDAMARKSTFFAVGAAHLGGEQGLIPLLEKQGYTLKPVLSDNSSDPLVATAQNYQQVVNHYMEYVEQKEKDGDILDAVEGCAKIIEILSKYGKDKDSIASAYFTRAMLRQEKMGYLKGALKDYDRAISLGSADFKYYKLRALKSRALIKQKIGDQEGALADFNQLFTLSSDRDEVLYLRGVLKADKLSDLPGALADFNASLALNPQNISCLIERGMLRYGKMKNRSAGIVDLRRAALLSRNKDNKEELSRVLAVLKAINVREIP